MIISLIVAMTMNNIIGCNNTIPWNIGIADLWWFKLHTVYKPVIMGRKTFESINKQPLLNRLNIVLSSTLLDVYPNVFVVNSPDRALLLGNNFQEIMIIGGGSIYNYFLLQSTRLYITYIYTNQIIGDVFFPEYQIYKWKSIFNRFYIKNKDCPYNLQFKILEKC